jgi:hypothetical protein
MSYNATVVDIYKYTTPRLAWRDLKAKICSSTIKRPCLLQRWRWSFKFRSCRIGSQDLYRLHNPFNLDGLCDYSGQIQWFRNLFRTTVCIIWIFYPWFWNVGPRNNNATSSLERLENKNIFFCFEKRFSLEQHWHFNCKFRSRRSGSRIQANTLFWISSLFDLHNCNYITVVT